MITVEAARKAIAAEAGRYTSYAKLKDGVKKAVFLLSDCRRDEASYSLSAYCPCVLLTDCSTVSYDRYPTYNYVVLSPYSKLLGVITEVRYGERMRAEIARRVSYETMLVSPDKQIVSFMDMDTVALIQVQLVGAIITNKVTAQYELFCEEPDVLVRSVTEATQYALWRDFVQDSDNDFNFEEVD